MFTSPEKVSDYLSVQMRDYKREVFMMLLLDSKHQLLDTYELFQGTLNAASVHPREVVARALRTECRCGDCCAQSPLWSRRA